MRLDPCASLLDPHMRLDPYSCLPRPFLFTRSIPTPPCSMSSPAHRSPTSLPPLPNLVACPAPAAHGGDALGALGFGRQGGELGAGRQGRPPATAAQSLAEVTAVGHGSGALGVVRRGRARCRRRSRHKSLLSSPWPPERS
jgi:hypothetical protein